MVRSYLTGATTEEQMEQELGIAYRHKGMLPSEFLEYLRQALADHSIELMTGKKDTDVLRMINGQLQAGIPVPIYFSTINAWDRPSYDTHYSAVVGMNPEDSSVTIANAYGYMETVAIVDFLDSLKYVNYRSKPFIFTAAIYSGLIGMNNIYIISR